MKQNCCLLKEGFIQGFQLNFLSGRLWKTTAVQSYIQRLDSLMKTTFCVSMYFEAVQRPNLNGWSYGHRSISQPNINVDIWLRNCWFCNNDQPFFNIDISTSNLADFWLNCGWEVDFWLIIVTKSTISQPNINVEDGWGKLRLNVESTLRSWSVPTGGRLDLAHIPPVTCFR